MLSILRRKVPEGSCASAISPTFLPIRAAPIGDFRANNPHIGYGVGATDDLRAKPSRLNPTINSLNTASSTAPPVLALTGGNEFAGLESSDDVQGEGQEDDFVQNFQDELHEHHVQDGKEGNGTRQGQREEEEGIGRLACYGTYNKTKTQAVFPGTLLHLVQNQYIEVTAHQERDAGCQRYTD